MGFFCKTSHGRDPHYEPVKGSPWILPPLNNSWIVLVLEIYKAANGSSIMDCFLYGGSAKVTRMFRDPRLAQPKLPSS